MQAESEWHKKKQEELRDTIKSMSSILNVRDFKAAKEVCGLIKEV